MRPLLFRTGLATLATSVALLLMLFVRERPIVQVTGGLVRGVSSVEGTKLFRSIPFAQPPLDELRWKPPMSPLPWSGVRDVAANAPPCLQARFGWNDSLADESSEDCLYLQVRTPRLDPSAKLPVMVWIHGGGNQAGAGRGYARSHIARRGVVLVMLQYRLGVFGFISHPELTAESPDAASGNYALQDQIAALEWVRDNIAAFGGDPANVTVFGQSAGAQDVGLLLVSPLSKDLFSKAIAQSGTATFGTMPRTLEENENIGKELARLAGAAGIAELRRKSGAEILRAAQSLAEPGAHDPSSLWLRAVIDGWVIRESPSATLASSKQRRVPLITGNNSRELPLRGGASQAQSAIEAAFREKAPQAMKLYGLEPGAMVSDDQTMQIATDITFRCPALHMAEMYAAAGVPVWHYEFAMTSDANGVHHSSELPFVFYDTPINGPAQPAVSLQDYWTQFARSGDPNSAELPDWPTFDAQHRSLYVGTSGPRVVPDLRHEICSLLPRS